MPNPPRVTERRFVLADFTYMDRAGFLRLYEAGRSYRLSRAVAHAAAKRELIAKHRPTGSMLPNIFRSPKVLTEAEVVEAEEELKALERHAFGIVGPEEQS
jgi:hypothetical protein